MEYVRGDRFGADFTSRRAASLHRFLKRLTLHPDLRRSALLLLFLESPDWNMTMKSRPSRGSSLSEGTGSGGGAAGAAGNGGVFENLTDTLMGAFSKVHRPDRRFVEVRDRADRLDDDLGHVEKVVARVVRRGADLEADYADLAAQFQRLVTLEPGVQAPLTSFARGVEGSGHGFKKLREHVDQSYLGSLRDMQAYIAALKQLLKSREQKQLDFEGLTDYLARAAADRDSLASQHGGAGLGASGFLRAKIEDVRGVDHEQSRRDRVRKLEIRIEELTGEVEGAKKVAEAFDEQTVREVADFERIKAVEFGDTLGGLCEAHIGFFRETTEVWERFVKEMEEEGAVEA